MTRFRYGDVCMHSIDKILKMVKDEGIMVIRFEWVGNDLLLRAKASHVDFLKGHLETGIGLTKGMQSFNALDHLVFEGAYGPESSEFRIFPDLDTFALVPYAPKNARLLCELYETDMKPSMCDARYLLRRMIERAEKMGFAPMVACETEFYVFQKNGDKIDPYFIEKYGTTRGFDLANDLIQKWIDSLTKMNVKVERIIKEYGHSQLEVTLRYTGALKAADDMVTLRDVARGVAANQGLIASFIPKPSHTLPGSGMHLHISLWDGKKNLFVDAKDKRGLGLSKIAYFFIGGIMKHMKALCPLGAPLPNSYKRLLLGSWAPSHIFYGWDNRAAAIRIPSVLAGNASATRIEYRLPDPAANPYIAIGSTIAAGLDGVKNEIDPGEPVNRDPMKLSRSELEELGLEPLPRTLGEAISEMKKDTVLRDLLGSIFFDEYVKVRESEWKAFREYVTEWEVKNYLESF